MFESNFSPQLVQKQKQLIQPTYFPPPAQKCIFPSASSKGRDAKAAGDPRGLPGVSKKASKLFSVKTFSCQSWLLQQELLMLQ